MSNLKRIGSFLSRNSFRILSGVAVVGLAVLYWLDKEAAAFLVKGMAGVAVLFYLAAGMEGFFEIPDELDPANADKVGKWSWNWNGKNGPIPGTPAKVERLTPDDFETRKEYEESRAWEKGREGLFEVLGQEVPFVAQDKVVEEEGNQVFETEYKIQRKTATNE